MLPVASRLAALGCDLCFSSSGEVTRFIRQQGFRCNDLPLVDVVFTDSGSFSAKATAKYAPLIFGRLFKQVGMEARNLIAFGAEAVLSDSMLSSVVAGSMLGLRTISVLNQLRLESSPKTPRIAAKLLSTGSITVGNEFWELSDGILLPDLPPPYTISERNIWGAGSAAERARYVGFLPGSRVPEVDDLACQLGKTGRRVVFWQVSGPPKTRTSILSKAVSFSKELGEGYVCVISAGDPGGSTVPVEIPGGFLYGWCPVKDAMIDLADVVVSRAGHVSISDFILRGKPSVLVPIPSQTEQEGNAAKADKLGVAVNVAERDLTVERFKDALAKANGDSCRRQVSQLAEVARRYDAVASITDAVTA
jgi:UDP-N-acetylglucosamine--N-acetylmuramyl-(pentapeptide) pyrophosphoryl-undecaprenol N-acetylglucosamine transferase